jgi:hypothetical protein
MTTRLALRSLIVQVAYTMVPGAYDTLMAVARRAGQLRTTLAPRDGWFESARARVAIPRRSSGCRLRHVN